MKAQQVASGPRVQREPGECPHQARQVPADNKGGAPGQGGVTGGQCRGLAASALELETKVIRRFPKISQSQRRPLQGLSSG